MAQIMKKIERETSFDSISTFDRLMRGLIAVPKNDLEAEIRKDQKKKAKDQKPKPKK